MSQRAGVSRIGSGRLAGRRLEVPDGIRPSGGRLREALFSILGQELENARFLDLFAGSGAIGIEAWSRGARSVTLVESERRCVAALRRNLALVPEAGATRLLAESVAAALARLAREAAEFDLLFADPPYADVPDARLFAGARSVAAVDARLVVEHRVGVELAASAAGWLRSSTRRYGDSALSLYEAGEG